MRIISKFKDYYDNAQAFGQDQSMVYHRITTEIELSETAIPEELFRNIRSVSIGDNRDEYSAEFILVGFCGKIYPIVKISKSYSYKPTYHYAVSVDDVHRIADKLNIPKKTIEKWDDKQSWWSRALTLTEFFARSGDDRYLDLFTDNKYVSFLIYDCEPYKRNIQFIINPDLSKTGLVQLIDPYAAFQEISMFLGGVLGSEAAPMVEIEDKYRIEGHGYDKWSFRKMPTKKR